MRALIVAMYLTVSSVLAAPLPTEIELRIEREGARNVLHWIFADSTLESEVYKSIARGSAPWLRIAVTLRAVSDAGATSLLNSAVAEALPNAPYRVLPLLLNGPFTPDDSCLPFLSDEMPPREALHAIGVMEATFHQVSSPKYSRRKATCLELAAKTRQSINGSLTLRIWTPPTKKETDR